MKILIDMNLTPQWEEFFARNGLEAKHWSSIGNSRASDAVLMDWAQTNGYVVFTHDLGFGALLAATGLKRPSVFQIRTHDVLPAGIGYKVLNALKQYQSLLDDGALVVLDESRGRVRILPLKP
jgi:predicted nuclease of predicted toxin-antitoxin system